MSSPSNESTFTFGKGVRHFAQQCEPLVDVEQWLARRMHTERHDDRLKQLRRALDEIDVPVGHRVKAPRVDR